MAYQGVIWVGIPTMSNESSQPSAAVLFDLDGTLCDTNYLHAVAWKRAFDEHHIYAHTVDLHRLIGMGSDQLMQTAAGGESDGLLESYERHFEEFASDIQAFPGASELLRATADLGARVVLASSAGPTMLKRLRKAIDAEDVLHAVTAADDVEATKPAPDIFSVAMKRSEQGPEACIAIGDTVWDVKAAGAAGIKCIGVLTGGISRPDLLEAGAVEVYKDVQDLLEHLNESAIGKLCAKS